MRVATEDGSSTHPPIEYKHAQEPLVYIPRTGVRKSRPSLIGIQNRPNGHDQYLSRFCCDRSRHLGRDRWDHRDDIALGYLMTNWLLDQVQRIKGAAREEEAPGIWDLHGGCPYWIARNASRTDYAQLNADVHTDVVIIGGGVTGALCAYHLIEAGVPCVVVDARSIGTGSTCASTALLQYEIDTPLHELIGHVGLSHAVRAYQASVYSVNALIELASRLGNSSIQPRKSVQYASRERHVRSLKEEAEIRNTCGIPVELLIGAETRQALPFEAPAALRSELAAEADAWRLTHALHDHSRAAGVQVYERTAIVDFHDDRTSIRLRTADGCTLRAKHLIYATGYASVDLLPEKVVDMHSTYALVTCAGTLAEPWPGAALIWETAQPYLYLRTAPQGRIIVGGRDEPFRSPALRDALLQRKTDALLRDLSRLLPDVQMRSEFAWCGTFGTTKDGLPYIDRHPRRRSSWFALGMGGNGITFSVLAAQIIRDGILGVPNPHMDLFRFDR